MQVGSVIANLYILSIARYIKGSNTRQFLTRVDFVSKLFAVMYITYDT